MITTVSELAKMLNVSKDSIRTYIFRWGFSHLDIKKVNRKFIINNITDKDIDKLKSLINRTKKKRSM